MTPAVVLSGGLKQNQPESKNKPHASAWIQAKGEDYLSIIGRHCVITLEPRPAYCDRGRWLAKLHINVPAHILCVDVADMWPRYYFDFQRAQQEVEAWMRCRKQWVEI